MAARAYSLMTRDQASEPTDEQLIARCAAGDAAALRLLFERHQSALSEYLYRLLSDREDAEEAVADVFVKAWRGAASFQGQAAVRNWLYRIATHTALDRLRRRKRQPVTGTPLSGLDERDTRLAAPPCEEPEAALLEADGRARDRHALHRALASLDPHDRSLVILHYFSGCSYEQICEITGHSLASVKSRLHRARRRMRDRFDAFRESYESPQSLAETRDETDPNSRRVLAF
jgi:RNA polymerase sigma-70 factor (ECF subfamily)